MENADLVIATVLKKLPLPNEDFPAGGDFWLTVYLEGSLSEFTMARPFLVSLGWLNLDLETDFSGFIYAKKHIQNEPNQINAAINGILQICANTQLRFSLIDADTSFDPSASIFCNLFKSLSSPQ